MPSARSAAAAPRRSRAPARPQPRPRRIVLDGSTVRRVRWDRVGRIALLVVLVVVVGLYVKQGLSLLATHSQAQQQEAIVHQLVHANAALRRQQNLLDDPATIEQDARALGMVRPGERPYVITGLASH